MGDGAAENAVLRGERLSETQSRVLPFSLEQVWAVLTMTEYYDRWLLAYSGRYPRPKALRAQFGNHDDFGSGHLYLPSEKTRMRFVIPSPSPTEINIKIDRRGRSYTDVQLTLAKLSSPFLGRLETWISGKDEALKAQKGFLVGRWGRQLGQLENMCADIFERGVLEGNYNSSDAFGWFAHFGDTAGRVYFSSDERYYEPPYVGQHIDVDLYPDKKYFVCWTETNGRRQDYYLCQTGRVAEILKEDGAPVEPGERILFFEHSGDEDKTRLW